MALFPNLSFLGEPADCRDVLQELDGADINENHKIVIAGRTVDVRCRKQWTVIQSRGQFGNPVDYFYRGWDEYVAGFGEPGNLAYR